MYARVVGICCDHGRRDRPGQHPGKRLPEGLAGSIWSTMIAAFIDNSCIHEILCRPTRFIFIAKMPWRSWRLLRIASTSFFLTLLFAAGLLRGSSRRSNAQGLSRRKAWSTLKRPNKIASPICLKPGAFTGRRKPDVSHIASMNSAKQTHNVCLGFQELFLLLAALRAHW